MAQRLTASFINTVVPGSYPNVTVKSNPVGVATSGNIVIVGEAEGGAATYGVDSVNGDVLKNNYYTPTQVDSVISKYISGPIVEAFRALASPSGDADITGAASRIYIAKTNTGVKASAIIPSTYGTLRDKKYGPKGNRYYYQVTSINSETAPSVTGTTVTFPPVKEVTQIQCVADVAGSLDGTYFVMSDAAGTVAFWIDETGTTPEPAHGALRSVKITTVSNG
ncbi:MAG: hypothetical protein PHF86_09710, partial [Candidatus Nanoarchaeia archaeon]|nr:hypothetical protein [Candidatus Nanoarchaeia archaeon]